MQIKPGDIERKPEYIGPDKEILLPLLKAIKEHGKTIPFCLPRSLMYLQSIYIPFKKEEQNERE